MFALRPYQVEGRTAIEAEWQKGVRSTMIEWATGSGKTELFVDLANRNQAGRTLVICPMNTLIGQAVKKFRKRTGITPAIEQASNWSNESDWAQSPFIVASKQTLCKARKDGTKRYQRFSNISQVIVDECHLSITKPYQELIQHFLAQGACVLGVTATAKRHDKRAMANLYESCAHQYGILDAVKDGWLVSAKTTCVQLQSLDLSTVPTVKGDFDPVELAKKLEDEKTIYEIADVTARESGSLKTVVFCASVEEAKRVAERLVDNYQLRAGWICADEQRCTKQRQKEVLESFTEDADGIQIVCNVGILTTGWDFPGLEHIVMARPTKSLSLYTQVFGRGTRALDGTVDFEGSTPDMRREAIAMSRKPWFQMTDLVDASLEHKIITCADVLGGKMSIEAVARAKKNITDGGGPVSIDEALATAQAQLEQEALDRAERARVRAEARYRKVTVDPFDNSQRAVSGHDNRTARMLFGKYKGLPLSQIPIGYLKWVDSIGKKGWFATAVKTEIAARAVQAPAKAATPEHKRPAVVERQRSFEDINRAFMEAVD